MGVILSIFVSDILPVFAIAGAGYLLAKFAAVDVRHAARIAFYALMPCLAFHMLTTADSHLAFGPIVLSGVLIILGMGVVGYLAGRVIGLRGVELRAFLMVVMFSNGGNYGLPVVRLAFGPPAMSAATVFFLTGSVMTYVISAFFAGSKHGRFLGAIEKVFSMPSLYGLAAATVVLWLGIPMPDALTRPITMLSDAALPVMILVLGMQLERAAMPERPALVLLAVGISLLAAPLVAFGFAGALGISGPARQAVITLSSMPVAVVTTILALEFEMSPSFVTSTVFLSTVLSPLTLAPLIAYLK